MRKNDGKLQRHCYTGAMCVSGICTAFATDVVGICHGYRWHLPWISLAFAVDVVGICRRYLWHLPRILLAIREWKAASYSILTQNTTIIE